MPTRISGFVIDSSGNAVSGVTVTPKASDGSSGSTGTTNTAGFFAIAGLADKVWTGTVTSSSYRVHYASETFQSDDIHNQSNTLAAHDFSQLRGMATASQLGTHVHGASDINSGQLALARGGTAADLSGAGANKLVHKNAADNAMEYGTVTEASGALGAVTSISGAAAIDIKPSGMAATDYLSHTTAAGIPTTTIIGGLRWFIESDDAGDVIVRVRDGATNYLDLAYDKANNHGYIDCVGGNLEITAGGGTVNIVDAVLSTSAQIPNGVDGTTVNASGEVCVDTTRDTLNFGGTGNAERVLNPVQSKAITIESPTSSEDLSLFYADDAITITKMVAVLTGSGSQSVTWTVRHGTDRSAAGAEVVTGGTATTSLTTGSVVTVFNDATVVADSFLWLETTALVATVTTLNVTIFYRQDP